MAGQPMTPEVRKARKQGSYEKFEEAYKSFYQCFRMQKVQGYFFSLENSDQVLRS